MRLRFALLLPLLATGSDKGECSGTFVLSVVATRDGISKVVITLENQGHVKKATAELLASSGSEYFPRGKTMAGSVMSVDAEVSGILPDYHCYTPPVVTENAIEGR